MRVQLALLTLVAGLACAPGALAETDSEKTAAADFADVGLSRYERGDYKEALEQFSRASALVHAPSFALYEARCLVKLGRLPEAEAAYERATLLDGGPTATPVQQWAVTDARLELIALRRRREAAPRAAEKPSRPPTQSARGPSKATLAVLGVGAAGLVVGVSWGAIMLSHKGHLDESCMAGQCPASQREELDGFHSARTVSTVGWAVGLLGVGLGAGMWIGGAGTGTSPPQTTSMRVSLSPTGATVIGTF